MTAAPLFCYIPARNRHSHSYLVCFFCITSLFRDCPESKVLFGFSIDMDPGSEEMQRSKPFLRHASYMINMLDRALNMLGPDAELLGEILSDLGKKHARLGVHEQYFPFMGHALLNMLREMLGNLFTPETEQAWNTVYAALSGAMVESMNTEQRVLDSWAKLKKVENYQEVAGGILFHKLFSTCPETKALFGFPIDLDMDSDSLLKSRRFQIHSKYFIEMLDKALGLIEAKQMEENMKQLGRIHAEYGVKEEYFPIMGESLFHTLEQTLKDDWNEDLKAAWKGLYGRLSSQMIAAMNGKTK